jgi:hypothetical protein
MKAPNITPGPWTPELPTAGFYDPIAPDGSRVCFIPSRSNPGKNTEANARLIAAAPQLAAALEAILSPSNTHYRKGSHPAAIVNLEVIEKAKTALLAAGYTE